MKIMSKLILMVFLFTAFPLAAFGAGMSVHTEVTTRAVHYFDYDAHPEYRQYILDHPEAYQAGSPFPDWGYSFGHPDESEYAHWEPWLELFAKYIHDTYRKPRDEQAVKLIAFFMGNISHDMADIDCHGLGRVDESFMSMTAQQEFHGVWGDAHSNFDTGAEFVDRHERDMQWLEMKWWFPTQDIINVYNLAGYTVTADDMEKPFFILWLGALGNRLGGYLLLSQYVDRSPILYEELNDYFMGGLDSMAVRVMWQWRQYIDLIEDGSGIPTAQTASAHQAAGPDDSDDQAVDLGWFLIRSGLVKVNVSRDGGGIEFSADVQPAFWELADKAQQLKNPAPEQSEPVLYSQDDYAYFGKSMATGDFNHDGYEDLAVGAYGWGEPGIPQTGAVYVFYGPLDIEGRTVAPDAADVILTGEDAFNRFGWSLAAGDFNDDGVDDLAVSAPTYMSQTEDFYGRVYEFFGGSGLSQTPDVTISGDHYYNHFGWDLAAGDTHDIGADSLVVGSPFDKNGGWQRGSVAVFLPSASRSGGVNLTIDDADWLATGEKNYDWFGYRVKVAHTKTGAAFLLVGAPAYDGSAQNNGGIYRYDAAKGASGFDLTFKLIGESEFDKMGVDFAVGDFGDLDEDCLAVSAPSKMVGDVSQAGVVYFFTLDDIAGVVNVADLTPKAVLSSPTSYTRLGWRLMSGDVNDDGIDDLLVSRPWRRAQGGLTSGNAYIFEGGSTFFDNVQSLDSASLNIIGTHRYGMLGSTTLIADIDGDGVDDMIIGSHRDCYSARHGGQVELIAGSKAGTRN